MQVPTWQEFVDAVPEFASQVMGLFTAHKHHVMATVRQDGSPRISGTEIQFEDGQLCFGMMTGARRGHDLRRDPRLAIHSHSIDPPEDDPGAWPGEAKVSGRATEVDPGSVEPGGQFRVEVSEVVLTRLDGHLVVERWAADQGVRRYERY